MTARMNRREFVTTAATAIGALAAGGSGGAAEEDDRVRVALIGVSGRGGWFVDTMPKISRVVALCDVNDYRAKQAYEAYPDLPTFRDYRALFDKLGDDLEAVVIAVPDHSHAVITAEAMRRGKHVFCEKPLTHDVHEARVLRRLARETGVATQMGNQGTASEGYRRAVELLQAGLIGNVREVHVWNTGGGAGERPLPDETHPVPDTLDWDVWLGPAAERPFNSRWIQWHAWRDFATGNLGNWASHTMNVAFRGLGIDGLFAREQMAQPSVDSTPRIRVRAEVSELCRHTFPRWEIIRFEVPARDELPPVTLNWYNGSGQAPGPRGKIEDMLGRKLDWGDAGEKKWQDHAGILVVGERGCLHSTSHNTSFSLVPEKAFEAVDLPEATLPRSRGHELEWLAACRGGPPAWSNFDYAGPLTEFVLLGNVATLFDGPLDYDPAAMRIVNNPAADAALKRDYRTGWSL